MENHAKRRYGSLTGTPALSPAAEKKPVLYFLGSSVTRGSANNGVSFADKLREENGWDCKKYAVDGTTLADSGSTSYISRMKSQIGKDAQMAYFVCQLSTNDASQNKPLGTVSDSRELSAFNTRTIIGAMEYVIAYAKSQFDFVFPANLVDKYARR